MAIHCAAAEHGGLKIKNLAIANAIANATEAARIRPAPSIVVPVLKKPGLSTADMANFRPV